MVHHAGEIPRLTLTAGGRSRVLFSQSQFKGREGKSPCRARQSFCKGAAGASRRAVRVFAAAAKTAAWHRLPGNRLGPVPLLSRNRLVADKNRRYVSHSKANERICELAPCVFPGQKYRHKVFRMQLLTYRRYLSTTSRIRERSLLARRRS